MITGGWRFQNHAVYECKSSAHPIKLSIALLLKYCTKDVHFRIGWKDESTLHVRWCIIVKDAGKDKRLL